MKGQFCKAEFAKSNFGAKVLSFCVSIVYC